MASCLFKPTALKGALAKLDHRHQNRFSKAARCRSLDWANMAYKTIHAALRKKNNAQRSQDKRDELNGETSNDEEEDAKSEEDEEDKDKDDGKRMRTDKHPKSKTTHLTNCC